MLFVIPLSPVVDRVNFRFGSVPRTPAYDAYDAEGEVAPGGFNLFVEPQVLAALPHAAIRLRRSASSSPKFSSIHISLPRSS